MRELIWCVYVHINKINWKMYVGITSQGVDKRWKNGYGYKSSPHFWNAIQKYGWDGFWHIILLDGLSEEEAKYSERYLIRELSLKNRTFGYNQTDGGDGVKGYFPSPEQRKAMSERLRGVNNPFYGKKRSKEFCDAISCARKGMTFTEEHRLHLRESHVGKILPEAQKLKIRQNSPDKVKVQCVETGEIFDSISDVGRYYGKDARHVSECCAGTRHTWNKLHWVYYDKE